MPIELTTLTDGGQPASRVASEIAAFLTAARVTLDLAADVLATLGDTPATLLCDKHGGRNRYAPLLQQRFPDHLVETRRESRMELDPSELE